MRSILRGSSLAILSVALSVGAASSAYAGQATGPRWRIAYAATTPMSTFSDAAVVSARDIWAVGDRNLNNGGSGTGPFVRRWNGHRWTSVRLPATYGDAFVAAVAASSSRNVWLFGEYDNNKYVFALRWNGSWKQMGRWPNVTGGADSALVIGRSDVWLFGEVGTLHYNGRSWHSYKLSVPLYEASAISASDIWAVGYPLDTYAPAVAHWHGGRWKVRLLPSASPRFPTTTPAAVLAFSDQNVWIAGAAQTAGGSVRPLLLHWSGRKWHSYLGPGHENSFGDLVPDGTGGFWLSYGDLFDAPAVVSFKAGRWRTFVLPHPRGKQTVANVLARVPRSRVVYALGEVSWGIANNTRGLILRYG
jgi:hypothetical protein